MAAKMVPYFRDGRTLGVADGIAVGTAVKVLGAADGDPDGMELGSRVGVKKRPLSGVLKITHVFKNDSRF